MRTITIAGPGMNALSSQLMTTIIDQASEADGEPILLTGEGRAFSAGLDLREVASLDTDGLVAYLTVLEQMVSRLFEYPGPVAAAVNGHAIAGGCVVALCADYRVIVDQPKVKMGLNEVALGVQFPPRTLAAVKSRIPIRARERVLLSGDLFGPEAARGLGLVDVVDAAPVVRATEWLERVGQHDSDAYAATKRAIRGPAASEEGAWERFVEASLPSWQSDDLRRRIQELLGRRG